MERSVLRETVRLLEMSLVPTADHPRSWLELQRLAAHNPDLNQYLVFILQRQQDNAPLRQAAGLFLKNRLRTAGSQGRGAIEVRVALVGDNRRHLLRCLAEADKVIQATTTAVISSIVEEAGFASWPDLFPTFLGLLRSDDPPCNEGAMEAFAKICEDAPAALHLHVPGSAQPLIEILPSICVQLSSSPHASVRKLALASLTQCIIIVPHVHYASRGQYTHRFLALALDPSPEVRKVVCAFFTKLIEHSPNFLEGHLSDVIERVVRLSKDRDEEVSLEAYEFWSEFCDNIRIPPETLRLFVPCMIKVLLSNLTHDEDDEDESDESEDDQSMHVVSSWNMRTRSASQLEMTYAKFCEEFLPQWKFVVQLMAEEEWRRRKVFISIMDGGVDVGVDLEDPEVVQSVPFMEALQILLHCNNLRSSLRNGDSLAILIQAELDSYENRYEGLRHAFLRTIRAGGEGKSILDDIRDIKILMRPLQLAEEDLRMEDALKLDDLQRELDWFRMCMRDHLRSSGSVTVTKWSDLLELASLGLTGGFLALVDPNEPGLLASAVRTFEAAFDRQICIDVADGRQVLNLMFRPT